MLELLAREPVHVMLVHTGVTHPTFICSFVRHCDGLEDDLDRHNLRGGTVRRLS